MKRRITIISLIFSTLLILDSMNFSDALAMFIIAGQIPGTRTFIDADVMLALFMTVIGFAAGRFTLRVMQFVGELPKLSRDRA